MRSGLLALLTGFIGVAATHAATTVTSLGTGPQPNTLGPYTLLSFGADARPIFADVSSITPADGLPVAGALGFSTPMNHRRIGEGWATWSYDYDGDIYWSNGATEVTLLLPEHTVALQFYVEPNPFETFDVTVTTNDGASVTTPVTGLSGANAFGAYTDDAAPIASITISSSVDFAVAMTGIFTVVPEPATFALLALGLLARRR